MRWALSLSVAVLLAASAAHGGSAAAQAPPVVEVPASIDPTGATDVTRELNELIASVPDGATIRFPPGAVYRAEGPVVVVDREGLTFEFRGATLLRRTDGSAVPAPEQFRHRWPRHRPQLYVRTSRDITVRDLKVRGPHERAGTEEEAYVADLEAQHAVELAGVTGALVEGGELSYVYGDGVDISEGSRDVVVRGVHVHHVGRQGIAVTGGADVTIEGNVLDQIRRSAFDVEPQGRQEVRSVRIVGNEVRDVRLLFVAAKGSGTGFDDLLIEGNHLVGVPMSVYAKAPDGQRRSNLRIVGNRSEEESSSPKAVIRVVGFDHVLVEGNHQRIDPKRPGFAVELQRSCGVVVRGNAFPGAPVHRVDDGFDQCDHLADVPRVGHPEAPPEGPATSAAAGEPQPHTPSPDPSSTAPDVAAGDRSGDDPGGSRRGALAPWGGAGAAALAVAAVVSSRRRRRHRGGAEASTPTGPPR